MTETDSSLDGRSRAVARLAAAAKSQDWLESLPADERPATLEAAYDWQDHFGQTLGYRSFGWKVAALSARALRNSASGQATFGQLWQECRFESGARLKLPKSGPITVEVEIAVRFARDVRPAAEAFDATMIDAAFIAFELVRSRFVDKQAAGHLSFVADDAGFHAFVLGEQLSGSLDAAELRLPASLTHDGRQVASQLEGENRNELAVSLAQFWAHAARRGLSVPAGSIVTTGSQTAPLDVRGCRQQSCS